MNVTTIGFPFASPAVAPVFGTAEQGFALALGAVTGLGGTPPQLGQVSQDNQAKVPTLPANDAPLLPDTRMLVRAQAGSTLTLAHLLAAGAQAPTNEASAQPGQPTQPVAPTPDLAVPTASAAPDAPETAALPATPGMPAAVPEKPGKAPASAPVMARPTPGQPADAPAQQAEDAMVAATPVPGIKTPEPKAAAKPADTKTAQPPIADAAPQRLETQAAANPTQEIAATGKVATPVKGRKPLVIDRDATPLPVDPLTAQQVAMAPVAVAPTVPTPQSAVPAAPTERKADAGRGGKAISIAVNQAEAPVADGNSLPDAKLAKATDSKPNDASLSDAALPNEMAAKPESRAAAAPQQSFAAHVNQAAAPAAPAPATHAAAAPPVSPTAEPMVPARAGELGHALGVEIARKVGAGEDTLRVRLNPVELGRVEVTLAFDDSGKLHATMRAESQHALDLLRQDAPDLGRALDSAGVRTDTQSFRFESRSDGSANSGAGGQSGQHQSRGNGQHAFNDEPETPAPVYRAIRTDGQVDLLA